MQYLLYAFSFMFGLVLGSFLNVVIYRLPLHESLARPGSHCPKCGTAIHWYDNVPVVSWLVLRGKCRSCQAPIAIRYVLVEAITGIAFCLAMWRFGLTWPLLVASVAIDPQRWWVYLAGSVGAAAFMFILVMVWPGGMGPGDIKMALFMGAVLGAHVIVALFAAFLFGSIAGIYIIVARKGSRKARIPFGPYLALGAVLAVFLGEVILRSYTSLYS